MQEEQKTEEGDKTEEEDSMEEEERTEEGDKMEKEYNMEEEEKKKRIWWKKRR